MTVAVIARDAACDVADALDATDRGPAVFLDDQRHDRVGSELAERERRVGAAETERVRQRRANLHLARDERNEVEIALRVLLEQIRSGWGQLMMEREHGEHRFDAASGAQQVAGHRFRRAHGKLARVIRECPLDRDALGDIAERCRCSVCVDVIDVVAVHAGIRERIRQRREARA